jgi:hypothetical protein
MLVPDKYARSPEVAPQTSNGKPFVASNRTGRISSEQFAEQIQDQISKNLEGFTPLKRGSRSRPSLLKYPIEIGSGQVPHVMQFKVFWRWEQKDMKETLNNAKVENEKKIGDLQTLHSLIENGDLTEENLMRSPLSDQGIAALNEIVYSNKTLKVVDPSMNDSLAQMLDNNPQRAKQILEQTISSYQTRLSDINSEISNGTGKVGLDEQEKLQVQGRFGEQIADSSAGSAAVSVGSVGAVIGGIAGFFLGGPPGAVVGALAGGGGGALAGVAAQQGAKAFQNQAVYDQMVSIYLPFCTKINNEDTFQYEESSMNVAGGIGDFMSNGMISSTEQAAQAGLNKGSEMVGTGQAGAALQGRIINPRLEKMFKQKDFRNFNFSWEFYPKTKTEVEYIRDIIETFRYHAHPSRENEPGSDDPSKVQIILRVPGEFEIRFLSSNPDPNQAGFVENEYLPQIGRCSLTSISVDYTPNSIYSSFQDNSPTAITFSLQFTEMGLLTREAIDKGY